MRGKADFDQALKDGEVIPIFDEEDGRTYYKWKEITAGKKAGTVDKSSIGGTQAITKEIAAQAVHPFMFWCLARCIGFSFYYIVTSVIFIMTSAIT